MQHSLLHGMEALALQHLKWPIRMTSRDPRLLWGLLCRFVNSLSLYDSWADRVPSVWNQMRGESRHGPQECIVQ